MATNADAQIKVSADVQSAVGQLKELEAAVKGVNTATAAFRNNKGSISSNFSDALIKDLKKFATEYEQSLKKINDVTKAMNAGNITSQLEQMQALIEAQEKSAKTATQSGKKKEAASKQSVTAIESEISAMQRREQLEKEYDALFTQRQKMFQQSSAAFDQYTQQYERQLAKQQQYENALSSREQITTNGFLRRIQNSAAYIAGYGLFNMTTSGLTAGLQAISDYEQGVTNLRRTLEQGDQTFAQFEASLRNFGSAAVEDAKEFGVAISDAQEAMTELARAGVGSSDLQGMTESVLMGLNTTELETASDVTSALVSTIKQMNMSWSDSEMILDSWNMLADRYAVQTDDFAHAIERSGAASKMLGMDLYDLNAVVTILGESTQASGEQVGTAFRSLSARLLRDSTIDKLAQYGIQVKDTNGQFLDFQTIMENINEVIKDLPDDSIVLSDIMDTLGGAWRKNWITALTQDFDRFNDLVREQAVDSVNYSAKENAKAMDTIAKKAQILKQTLLEAFIDLGEDGGLQDAIKSLLDGASTALESAINSPTLRSVLNFLAGNPLEALGVTAATGLFKKFTGGNNPIQSMAALIATKIPNNPNTLGGFLNSMYNSTGVSGKQSRAQKLYDQLKNTYQLTDTEMIPVASRIDDIFQSNTTSIAQTRSEVDRLAASLSDAETAAKTLFSPEGQDSYRAYLSDMGVVDYEKQTSYLEREQKLRMDNVVSLQHEYDNLNKKVQAVDSSSSRAAERGLFSSLESSRFKEGLRSFAGGLASGAAQMVAIAAAAKGLDYVINWNENQHEAYTKQFEAYQEVEANLKQQQEMVEKIRYTYDETTGLMMDSFDAEGALVSSTGENLGLSKTDYNSFLSQLEELKSIHPSVSSAIEDSALKLGNYGEAASVAAQQISKLREEEARTFLSDSSDEYEKNIEAWNNELRDEGYYNALQKAGEYKDALKGMGLHGDDTIAGNLDVLSDNYALSNLEKLIKNRSEVEKLLKKQGRDDSYIEDFFNNVYKDQETIRNAVSEAQERGLSELTANMSTLQDAFEGTTTEAKISKFEDASRRLSDLIGSAQSVNQAQQLEKFASRLSGDADAFVEYGNAQKKLAESMSKSSIDDISNMIKDYTDSAKEAGMVNAGEEQESLANALFEQYLGFDEADYKGMVNKLQSYLDSTDIDLSKAFGVDKISDIKANQFQGIYDFMNELTMRINDGSVAAMKFRDALNNNVINGINWENLDKNAFSNFFQLNADQADQVINAMNAIETKASGLGQSLSQAFGGDSTAAFEQLTAAAVAAQSSAEDFSASLQNMFTSLNMTDVAAQAQLINDVASALNVELTDEILLPLGFKIENGAIVSALSEAEQAAQNAGDVKVPISGEYKKGSAEQAAQEAENAISGTDATIEVGAESNPEEAQQAAQETASAAENTEANVEVGATGNPSEGQQAAQETASAAKNTEANVEVGATAEPGSGAQAAQEAVNEAKSSAPEVDIPLNFDFSSSSSIMGQVNDFLQGGSQDVEVRVTADTTAAEAQIERLLSSEETAQLKVQADTTQAQSDIQSLLTSDSTATMQVNVDTSDAISQISSISDSVPTVDIEINADTSGAQSAISSLASSASSSLSGLSSKATSIANSVGGIVSRASMASASLTNIVAQVTAAQAALAQLQAIAATPVVFTIDVSQLNNVPPAINAASAAAQAGLNSMRASIQSTAAAFSAGCAQMVSAWASMSFPAPHIPMPTVSVSAGVGTYSANISWHAKGGIVPATPGGRIVGVAEGGEDEAIVPISKLQDYIKSSMSDVMYDFNKSYSSEMEQMWDNFSKDYNTYTSNGYYATKVKMPFLELSPEAKDILNKFSEAKPIDLENFDIEKIDDVIKYITHETSSFDRLIEDAEDMIEFYDAYGDSIGKARAEVEKFNLQWKQVAAIQEDANQLVEQANRIQQQAGVDLSQYLDMNYELNDVYDERNDSLEDIGEETTSVLDSQIQGYQKVIQKIDELKDKLHELNVQMLNDINDLATDFLESSIKNHYESQKSEIEDRLDLIEEERDAYLDDLEEQRDRLESAKDDFTSNIELQDKELQDKIDAIRDEQERREDEQKLKDLQDKIKDAEERLNGLNNEYNTKVYSIGENGEWQFSYEADPEELEDAQKDLEEAQNDLKEFYEDQEIKRLEKEQELLQEQLDNYNKQYDDMMEALDKQQEAREEAWDDETESLQDHLDELNEMQEYAMDHLGEMAKKLIDYLMSVMGGDMSKVYDYLQVANGNYGTESYNPLGGAFMNDYAKSIAATGKNLEEYTNQLLEITRNPLRYDANQVLNAKNELEKLGTTGSIDLSDRIEITPQLAYALGNSIGVGLNEYIYSLLSRVGSVRPEDSGTGDPHRGSGYVVTAEHVADYMNKLGIDVSAAMVQALSDSLNAYDYLGSVGDVMQNIFSGLSFDENGLASTKDFSDLLNVSDQYLDKTSDIYDIANVIGLKLDDQVSNSEKLISQISLTQSELQEIKSGNATYSEILASHISELTGKMDANTYFSSENAEMSEELLKAMNGSTDVNSFILEELRKIGTVQKDGDKAGQVYTKDDAFSYLESLGISEELITNTVTTTLLLQETQQEATLAVKDNIVELSGNTKSVNVLNKTNEGLDRSVSRNTSSVYALDNSINELIDKLKEYTESIKSAVSSAASSAKSAAASAKAAAASAAAAAAAAAAGASSKSGGSFADGGVISYTGNASVHGTPTAPEVVFNASDAKKLYDIVHNGSFSSMPNITIDLTKINLPKIDRIRPSDVTTPTVNEDHSLTIENITMEFPQVNDPDGVKDAIINLSRDIRMYTK